MSNFKKTFMTLIMLAFVASCSSSGGNKFTEPKQPREDEAIVYFYRPSSVKGSLVSYDVKDAEGNYITTMKNGKYTVHSTTAGKKYFISKTESKSEIDFEVENGKVYFVKGGIKMGVVVGRPKLELMTNMDKALSEIKQCSTIE